jgi:SAM-dependent methyltransferase
VTEPIGRFSCVVDEPPRFHLDALRWFACLTRQAGVDSADLVVHVVGDDSSVPLEFLRKNGVTVDRIERFDERSPHCNKIAGALRASADGPMSTVVLCDADLAILEDPRQLAPASGRIAGKPVDAPNPPLEVLESIFTAAGVTLPATVPLTWGQKGRTLLGHFNGGLYLIPGPDLGGLAGAWSEWACWLLDRLELLGEWTVYVDQVAMTLALAAQGFEPDLLDVRWNTPTHDLTRMPNDVTTPAIIHYHDRVDEQGLLRKTGVQRVDRRIDAANAAIASVWREVFGTGQGSPPPAWRRPLVEAVNPRSILELRGDGRAEILSASDAKDANGRPPVEVRRLSLADLTTPTSPSPLAADVTFLEVRADQASSDLRRSLRSAWDVTARCLVVSSTEPAVNGSAEDESLWSLTQATIADAELYPVEHRGDQVTALAALRSPAERHPRDFSPGSLAAIVTRHPDPLALMAIRLHAHRSTGFYPDHAPRLWEYPVVADLVQRHLDLGSRLIDVGAGVSPLAPFLAARGYVVDTVDPSPRRRRWPPDASWNEWDFLDYRRAGLAHRSWNRTLDRIPRRLRYDGVVSVSVIEHLPAVDRRSLLAEMARRTRAGGLLILTIDLIRGSDALWNRNLGVEVEDLPAHGTLDDVVEEATRLGLELHSREVVRDWGDVDVDIALLVFRQAAGSEGHAQ